MFGVEEDDTDFLSPTGGAKLASLFGMDQTANKQGNESFQYTAPKQPKKGPGTAGQKPPKAPGSASSGPAPSVLFATAVHAYRFINAQYVKQGKFGVAVLGNHVTKEYRVLLYISQQQQIAAARIHPGFMFTVQLNNYATFYDDQRQNWSVMFESETSAVDFSKQICIAKCNASPSLESVLWQDLLPGDGQAADVGDLLEVAYTGWLYQDQGLGQMFDSNLQKEKLLRLKLGSGKVIKGWEDGMLGMKKGSRRMLVVPPALGYGPQGLPGRIPSNSTLLFDVEVKRIKLRDSASDRQSVSSRDSPVSITDSLPAEALPQPPSSMPPLPGEPTVRTKSNSISEQLVNPDVAKAKLISRMAKMGQPMLPFLAGSGTAGPDSSDSEMEDPNLQRVSPHPATPLPLRPTPHIGHAASHGLSPVPPQPLVASALPAPSVALLPVASVQSPAFPPGTAPALGFQPYAGGQYSYSPNQAPVTQLQAMAPVYPPQIQQHSPFQGDITSFLMTEARQQSTEIRMSIGKVIDKIDTLASKVDGFQKENSGAATSLLPGIFTMESSMIMNNIQRIIQENERLKLEVLEKSGRIEEQNVKIGELITRNQRYVEQSNLLLEQRNDTLQSTAENTQARVLHAVQGKADLGRCQAKVAEELTAATAHLSKLQLDVAAFQKKEMELRTQLASALQEAEKCKAQLSTAQVQLIEVQEASEQTRSRVKTEKDGRRHLEVRLSALEEEVSDLKVEKANLEKSLAEKKQRAQQDRQRAEEEREELRRTFQEEMEGLRQLLRKTREQAAADQRSSSRDIDLDRLSGLEERASQVQPLREKCVKLQAQLVALTEEFHRTQAKAETEEPTADPTEEVKKIMNRVFQSLRNEFDLDETYSGRAILGAIMSTIKATTLQLLNKEPAREPVGSDSEEEDDTRETQAAAPPVTQAAAPPVTQVAVTQAAAPPVTQAAAPPVTQAAAPPVTQAAAPPVTQAAAPPVTQAAAPPVTQAAAPPVTQAAAPAKWSPGVMVRQGGAHPKNPDEEREGLPQQVDDDYAVVIQNLENSLEEGQHYDTKPDHTVLGEESVAVFEEVLESFSALVHMVCSDMSGSAACVDTGPGQTDGEGKDSPSEVDVSAASGETETAGEGSPVPTTIAKTEDLEDRKPKAPLLLESDEDGSSPPLPPTATTASRRPPALPPKPPLSLDESDDDDLFKLASPRTQKPKPEEEDEEEVSLKGRPPPAPLFGDDDDDDDMGW